MTKKYLLKDQNFLNFGNQFQNQTTSVIPNPITNNTGIRETTLITEAFMILPPTSSALIKSSKKPLQVSTETKRSHADSQNIA